MAKKGVGLREIASYIHLARRSGALAVGYRAVKKGLGRGTCRLVLLAEDAGESLTRLETGRIPIVTISDKAELGNLLGRNEVAILGINDPHLAAAIAKRSGPSEAADTRPV
ncbi:MAG: hypothetical protein GY835_06590 [bacterium]|nr:hypothetical protein [bacterium]